MKDIQLIKPLTGILAPSILGKTTVDGLMLYQKIVTLLLSSNLALYRELQGSSLIQLLQGANTPLDSLLQTLGISACSLVKQILDSTDIAIMSSLTATALNGILSIHLTLKTGLTYTGVIAS